jgi:glucosylglycerate synthase
MAENETLAPEVENRLATARGAEVVVVLPGIATPDALNSAAGQIRLALDGLAPGPRTVLVHPSGIMADEARATDTGGPALVPFPIPFADQFPTPGSNLAETYRAIFQASTRLGARACVILGSDPRRLAPEALRRLVEPVVEQSFDLVTPVYIRARFEALLQSGVVTPAIRALYGKRIRFPIGSDFGISSRLVARQLQVPAEVRGGSPVWLTSEAITAGFQVGQAQLGLPIPAQKDPPEVSAAVAQVLGALFLDIDRNASYWQKVRGSQPVPTFGTGGIAADEPGTVDVSRIIETFQLGYRNLRDVWSAVLPPATLLELKRLTGLTATSFRLPDDLWARIVYDFALAHRLRIMNRDHLLKAMTPVYLAWVASYTTEVGAAAPAAIEYRLERLGAAFESQKPYLVSRWRWPDRFNP